MTSRTTPVGILVIALAGIFAMGCNAQTSAVFEALLDPGRAPVSSSEADGAVDDAAQSVAPDGWWPYPGGFRMTLPPGWFGVDLDQAQSGQLIDAVATTHAALAARIEAVLLDTRSRVRAVAADPSAGEMSPVMVVLQQAAEGRGRHEIKQQVRKQIAQVPGLVAAPFLQDAGLPKAKGWRFDYSIDDADLGALRVRSYLFIFGQDAYLVSFVAPESVADDADSVFDGIADSLQLGV